MDLQEKKKGGGTRISDCFNGVPRGKQHYFILYNADKATERRVRIQREVNTSEYRGKLQK